MISLKGKKKWEGGRFVSEVNNIHKRILNKATKDPGFSKFIQGLEIDAFEGNKTYEFMFGALSDYYREHREPATKAILETFVYNKLDRQRIPEADRIIYRDTLKEVYTIETNKDEEVFDDLISKHIEQKRTMYAIKMLALQGGDDRALTTFEEMYHKIKKDATVAGRQQVIDVADSESANLIADYIDSIDSGLVTIPVTPYQMATGGLSKGELALIGADSGGGKSLAMVSLAVEYLLSGNTVFYVDLEELQGRKFMRFYKALIGRIGIELKLSESAIQQLMPRDQAGLMFRSGNFQKMLEKYSEVTGKPTGKLMFTRYEPHTLSTAGLRQEMENVTMIQEEDVDVIFVDYPDLLRIKETQDTYRAVGIMFEELRAIAQEYQTVMWTASQLNRKSEGSADLRTGSALQGSIQKKNAVEALLTIGMSNEERTEGFGRIYVDKSRNGNMAGQAIPFKVDLITGLVRGETEQEAHLHETLLATTDTKNKTREEQAFKGNKQGTYNQNLGGKF